MARSRGVLAFVRRISPALLRPANRGGRNRRPRRRARPGAVSTNRGGQAERGAHRERAWRAVHAARGQGGALRLLLESCRGSRDRGPSGVGGESNSRAPRRSLELPTSTKKRLQNTQFLRR